VRDVLIPNGLPTEKITLCRQGIERAALDEDGRSEIRDQRSEDRSQRSTENSGARVALNGRFTKERPLRLAYLGRLDPTKGVHVLLEAMRLGSSLPVTLDIYGTAQGEGGTAYATRLKKLAGDDPRIRFCSPVPADQVVRTLREYDILAVPSQWLETGPLVVLEAFAAGVPVIGSDLGGIAELVTNGVNGFLVNPSDAQAWHKALKRFCAGTSALRTLYPSISRPPTMSSVAQTMIGLYQKLLVSSHAPI
jgi:glycosyltransferase involved in cell wall biosynthesis